MTIRGEYIAKRDNQIYAYEATANVQGQRIVWNAKVRRDGVTCGEPNGTVLNGGDVIHEDYIRAMVEQSIEHRVGVA